MQPNPYEPPQTEAKPKTKWNSEKDPNREDFPQAFDWVLIGVSVLIALALWLFISSSPPQ